MRRRFYPYPLGPRHIAWPDLAARCLWVVMLWALPLAAQAQVVSAELPQFVRTISTIVVVERMSSDETTATAERRIAPIISIANRFIGPVGFAIQASKVVLVDSNSRESSYEAFLRIHTQWHLRPEARQLVVFLMNGIRPDGKVGLSFPMTSCDVANALVMIAYTGSGVNDARRSGQTLAHEIGHVLGASHDDETRAADGRFSLMYTYAPLEISGFSEKSMRQIEKFAEEGSPSGGCYANEEVIAPKLEIDGPSEIQLMEGENVVAQFYVNGTDEPVFLQPEGLPPGSSYNVETGELRLLGDVNVAKPEAANLSTMGFEMIAETFSSQVSKPVAVYIHRLDLSPVFADGPVSQVVKRSGKKVSYSTSVSSPDGSAVSLACNKLPRGSKLKVRVKHNVVSVTGKLRRGEEQLRCMATAGNGLAALKSITFVGTRR